MKHTELVEQILRDVPQARNSDLLLIVLVWEHYGITFTKEQLEALKFAPMPEKITRARRRLQEKGEYLGDPKIMEERYRKFRKMRVPVTANEINEL